MAAYSKGRTIAGAFGNRYANKVWTVAFRDSLRGAGLSASRGVHSWSYDKNYDEHVRGAVVVPEDVIETQSDKYWGPHPHTGVFVPPGQHHHPYVDDSGAGAGLSSSSILDLKAWFRPLEDVDKPAPPHA